MAKITPTLFREYDIRGRENDNELNPRTVYLIARAYGTFLKRHAIQNTVVGHDNRRTSEEFYAQAVLGICESGVDVIGLGMVLTPITYWSQHHFKTQGGCMVTASHNPAGWNGMKLGYGLSKTVLGDDIQEIRRIAESEDFESGNGSFREQNVKDAFVADILRRATLHRKLRIVVNTANATSSFFSPEIFRKFGCEVIEHNTNPDPSYPNYVPNPANVEMMADTGRQVVKHKADIGIAIDADGDRLGICDEKGETIWPDRYMILLSRLTLKKFPGAKIVFDVKVSEALPEDIKAHGGTPIMWRTGYSYITAKMREEGAVLAGEQSGHIFFAKEYLGFDDANFAALKVLEYVSGEVRPVSELIADTPYYISTPAYHAHIDDTKKYAVVDALQKEFKAEKRYRVVDINGARVYMEDGWGLVRPSSNLPALVIRFEAKSEAGLKKIENIFRDKLKKFPEVSTEWDSA